MSSKVSADASFQLPSEDTPKQSDDLESPATPRERKTERRSSHVQRRTTEVMNENPDLTEAEEAKNDEMYHPFAPQIRAMFYRKLIYIKRSWLSVLSNILVTLVVSCLAIIIKLLIDSSMKDTYSELNYATYKHNQDVRYIVVVADDYDNKYFQQRYVKIIQEMYLYDTGIKPTIKLFDNEVDANKFIYQIKTNDTDIKFVDTGYILPSTFNPAGGNNITMMWNDSKIVMVSEDTSTVNDSYICLANLYRIELAMLTSQPTEDELKNSNYLKETLGYDVSTNGELSDDKIAEIRKIWKDHGYESYSKAKITYTSLAGFGKDMIFACMSPLLITCGITSVISSMITGPIIDIQGPIRSYMVSCSLQIFPYWIVTFIIDLCIWLLDVIIVWIVFYACDIKCFADNVGPSLFIYIVAGPSFILYIYVLSFFFTDPNSAARNGYILNVIILIIPLIVTLVTLDMDDPINSMEDTKWLSWIYGLFPPLLVQGFTQNSFLTYSYYPDGVKQFYKKDDSSFAYAVYIILDIPLYAIILFIIEYYRIWVQRKLAHSNFGDYGDFFKEAKAKHPVTEEADQMAEEVANNHDYAVRIDNVSRLFFNTEGNPIPAVNCVSLGVKKGSLFGFLGANGAGKTTLMNMITSMLPISDGKIEIDGVDISEHNDPSLLSVCPQFNTHLCMDMTISEHLHFYSLLHKMAPDHEKRNSQRLIKLLDLEQIKDIPIRELSEGDVRKLSIALSFLGRAKIILLDEPTATLDPVSRRQVHELILYYKGQKTFMLCTHLLSEAEALCDMISIMIKGNVYTCGSPQYLSSKFGTDFKIDMMLKDESEENGKKVDKFIQESIPQAELNIKRPSARIYNVLASTITLSKLFRKMEEGLGGDNGFSYYTCSSSSLEKVFMEIVKMSEGGEEV